MATVPPYADAVAFVAASSGTGSFVYSAAVSSYRTPAQANSDGDLVDQKTYSYFAVDSTSAPTQREWGHTVYTQSSNTFTRVVLGGVSSGSDTTTSPVNFTVAPSVFLTALGEDLVAASNANIITLTADTNIAAGTSVSIDTSGNAVQTWGPAINTASTKSVPTNGTYNILKLDATHFLLVQIGVGIYACSISGNTISIGAQDTSAASVAVATGLTNICAISGSSFAVLYAPASAASVVAATISGNTITYGAVQQISATNISLGQVSQLVALSSSLIVCLYRLTTNPGNVIAGSVSGNTITLGSAVQLTTSMSSSSAAQFANCIVALSSTSFAVSYSDAANANARTFVVGTVSGTTITNGSGTTTSFAAAATPAGICAIDSTHIVASTQTDSIAASISGTTLTFGTHVAPPANTGGYPVTFGSNFLLPGSSATTITGFAPIMGTLSGGTTITYSTTPVLLPAQAAGGNTTNKPIAVFSGTKFTFFDSFFNLIQGNGTSISLDIKNSAASSTSLFAVSLDSTNGVMVFQNEYGAAFVQLITANAQNVGPIGFAASAITSGLSGNISLFGSIAGFTGLTTGSQYFHNGDGTIITQDTGLPAGVALNSTTLLANSPLGAL